MDDERVRHASRVVEVDLPDASKVLTDYGGSVTAPIGVTKQITDQAGKKREGYSDALGNMIRVIEDPTGQNLNTDYVFDGGQSGYDRTGNPENNQWTAAFEYDVFGNVVTATDAKGIVATNIYDQAGRILTTAYSDGTPQVDYYYDGTGLSQIPQFAS